MELIPGTGTSVGDPMEIAAITEVYSKNRLDPLYIGSVKTNIGHTEAVSGITGIIKVVLSMKNERIPPHLNFDNLNPEINLGMIPAQIPLEPTEWKRVKGSPRLAGVSSFGISGTDGHTIIQEAPLANHDQQISLKLERPLHIFKICGKTPEALDELLQAYGELLENTENDSTLPNSLANVAYTSNTGRATFNQRAVVVAKDCAEAAKILKGNLCKRKEVQGEMEANICFLFTGQGSQYLGMARDLYYTSPVFRLAFDKCNQILETKFKIEIKNIIWNIESSNLPEIPLNRTIYSQLSIFVVEYSLLRLWESWGIKPNYALGHSLGEFAAAVCTGILDIGSALELVVHRSILIDGLPTGKMLVIRADKDTVDYLILSFQNQFHDDLMNLADFPVDLAAVNSPDQTVLAGDSRVVERFAEFCTSKDVKSIILASTHAFHSRHMDPILEQYGKIVSKVLSRVQLSGTKCQYISGVEGRLISDLDSLLDPNYWIRHTREKVNFTEASQAALQEGCNIFLEVGPSPILSTFIMGNNTGNDITCLPSLRRNQSEWSTLLDTLSKLFLSDFGNITIDWAGFDQYYNRNKVDLPFYPFQRKKIWVDFVSTPGKIHPLLGRLVPNASKSIIFENNEITLKQLSYLNDHVIGNTVVMPGAAFLEMCVVAGHCAVQGLQEEFSRPRRAINITDLKIEAPLALLEGKRCTLQTIVKLKEKSEKENEEERLGYSVTLHNWFQDENCSSSLDGQWKTHASANFLPLVADEEKLHLKSVDIGAIQGSWEKIDGAKDMYEKLPEVGLHFGSSFQSLVCGWKSERNANEEENEEEGLLFEVKVPCDQEDYLIHPVILDAMLQASMLWMSKNRIHKKLHVPVQIQDFTWYSDGTNENSTRFVYCTNIIEGQCHHEGEACADCRKEKMITLLLDEAGNALASMSGIEFIETTVKLVEAVIQQQSCAMPQLWEEIWKPKSGPLQGQAQSVPLNEVSTALSTEVWQTCQEMNELPSPELYIYYHLNNLTVLYFLDALYKLGWIPEVGQKIRVKEFMIDFGIVDVAWNFMKYFFNELVKERILEVGNRQENEYIVKALPESKENVEKLCLQTVSPEEASRGDYRIISEMGKQLSGFLAGTSSPLTTLFPEDPAKPNLECFYDSMRPWVSETGSILNRELATYSHLFHRKDNPDVTFRVLEVGAGTGSGTKDYLKFLTEKEVNFEYTFTDISAAFFINAEVKFAEYKNQIKFKKFNVEEDPFAQGLCPEYYDFIIACEVLHATRDIRQTLTNLRMLLKTNGHIQITETIKPDRRITLLVGLLEGYWRFTDVDLRSHPTLPSDKWISLLGDTGYKLAFSIGCYNDVHSYICAFASEDYAIHTGSTNVFQKLSQHQHINQKEVKAVKDSDTTEEIKDAQYSWLIFCDGSPISQEIQRRLKFLNRAVTSVKRKTYYNKNIFEPEKAKRRIFRTLKQMECSNLEGILYFWGLNPSSEESDQEHISMPFVHLCQGVLNLHDASTRIYVVTQGSLQGQEDSPCVRPETATLWGIAKTLRNEQPDINMSCIDLSPEELLEEQIDCVFYELFWTSDGEELIAFRDGKRLVPRLASLKINDESLNIPSFCDRFQLVLPESKAISDLEFDYLNNYSLKDDEVEIQVKACALNFRDIFAVLKPTSQFDNINSIGSDFAGIVTKVGAKVTKRKVGDAVFGMNTEQQALPSHIKFKENLVIPMPDNYTFAEAATIPAVFATALYCLVSVAKIKKGDVVLIHTASGGVGLSAIQVAHHLGAIVIATAGSKRKRAYLKSLGIRHVFHSRNTDYGDQILKVTNNRGVDVVLNSLTGPGFKEASLGACAQHARFVEMSKLSIWTPEEVRELREDVKYTIADLTALEEQEWKELLIEMDRSMNEKYVEPIPYTRFDALSIRQALNYLQKAKHIGKVVCVMPEAHATLHKDSSSSKTLLFNDRSTYLITGGLGGIGFEVAKFMLDSGAKHLILAGRSNPKSEVEAVIKSWNGQNKHVAAWQVDVGDYDKLKTVINKIQESDSGWPPLRGVMHAAGVLQDATLSNQVWDKFEKTYNAKLNGSVNLHKLTKNHRLEHFVLFSSVTSLFGSPGQSNHSASNHFEDAFAQYRHSIGLPATTINWANWGECGVAQDIDFPGIRPIATRQGLRALEAILKSTRLQVCVMNVDSFGLVAKLFPKVKGYVNDKRLLGDIKVPRLIINTDQFWGELDNAEGRESKVDIFKRYIKDMLKSTLKMDHDENIDDNAEFQSLGVDSLMLLEMKNYLQNLFGNRLMLTASHLKDCNSTISLATRLVDILEGKRKQDEEDETSSIASCGSNPIELLDSHIFDQSGNNLPPQTIADIIVS